VASTVVAAHAKLAGDVLAPFKIVPVQWAILEQCAPAQGTTATLLARVIPIDSASISRNVERLVQRLGEPLVSEFVPADLDGELARVGFAPLDKVPPEEQARRYLPERHDMAAPAPNFSFALYERTGPVRTGTAG